MANTTVVIGPQIYVEHGILSATDVIIENQKIQAILPASASTEQKRLSTSANILRFPRTWHLIPGMIDLHIHGVAGKDMMDAAFDPHALPTICAKLPAEGTTSFLATTTTSPTDTTEKVLQLAGDYIIEQQTKKNNGAEILGINLEGPFLSLPKHCAHQQNLITQPNAELFKHWQTLAHNLIKIVTIAPEVPHALALIAYLKANNIIASLGHSNATYEQTLPAIKAGISHATHLFNAMRSIYHRDPGNSIALLLADDITVELIVDGIHLHPAMLQLVLKTKKLEDIILVTDAMRAKGMLDGEYELGGQAVTVKDGAAKLKDGTLAGSILKMDQAFCNMLRFTHCSMHDAIKMTAENPAKKLNIFDRKGSIVIDKDADLVVLNENYQVMCTLCRGEVAYSRDRNRN